MTTTTVKKPVAVPTGPKYMSWSDIKPGDLMTESTKYIVTKVLPDELFLKIILDIKGGKAIMDTQLTSISKDYALANLQIGVQYKEVREVGLEDKADGTPGIRTIWERLGVGQPFSAKYKKQDEKLSVKEFEARKKAQREEIANKLAKVKESKKGVESAALALLEELQNNPVLPYEEGEMRVLNGYKLTNDTRDGRYEVADAQIIASGSGESVIRYVNIVTLEELITPDGILYRVKRK